MYATNVARVGKRGNICVGNNVSATMCPSLPGPLERFSFECRKVIGFAFATLHDWLKKFAPIRSKTKTNRDIIRTRFPALCVSYL